MSGAVLCTVGYLTASMASTNYDSSRPPPTGSMGAKVQKPSGREPVTRSNQETQFPLFGTYGIRQG